MEQLIIDEALKFSHISSFYSLIVDCSTVKSLNLD
jgi:hypothetical protein